MDGTLAFAPEGHAELAHDLSQAPESQGATGKIAEILLPQCADVIPGGCDQSDIDGFERAPR